MPYAFRGIPTHHRDKKGDTILARKVRHSALESRSARLRLAVRRKPYGGPSLARGVVLLYRRNKGSGSWVLKASDGHGAYWTKGFAQADDYDDSDGKTVLTFYEAQDRAKQLARGAEDGGADTAPITVDGALKDYRRDLEARNANPYNAESPRVHLTTVLLAKPVQLLSAHELKKWRDGLLSKMAPATVNRVCRCLCAALELVRQHDERIQNRQAWEVGLAGFAGCARGTQGRHPGRQGARIRHHRIWTRSATWSADRCTGDHRSAAEPGGALTRRGFS
jgi:hypothetical protein